MPFPFFLYLILKPYWHSLTKSFTTTPENGGLSAISDYYSPDFILSSFEISSWAICTALRRTSWLKLRSSFASTVGIGLNQLSAIQVTAWHLAFLQQYQRCGVSHNVYDVTTILGRPSHIWRIVGSILATFCTTCLFHSTDYNVGHLG